MDSVLIAPKKAGEEPQVRHKAAITEEDLEKLKGYFADVLDEKSSNAVKLCEYCWFIITCHFCLRASEIQASLKDVVFNRDGGGTVMFVSLGVDFMSKNCPGGFKVREFTSAGRITLPRHIFALQKLFSHLHPSIDRMFQRVHSHWHPSVKVWFMKAPLGHILGKMMSRITEKARLSNIYTNHCSRATSITLLKKAGFSDLAVCAVSGHKNVANLSSYCRPFRCCLPFPVLISIFD